MKKNLILIILIIMTVLVGIYSFNRTRAVKVTGEMVTEISSTRRYSDAYDIYKNNIFDYEIPITKDMKIDESLPNIRTRLYNDEVDVDIFFDNLKDKQINFGTYTSYGNKFLNDEKYHKLLEDKYIEIDGYKAHVLSYTRDKLLHVENDKNYYYSVEINVDDKMVYTIFVKSANPISDQIKKMINSFKIGGNIKNYNLPDKTFKQIQPNVNEQTLALYNQYFINSNQLTWGIFEANAPKKFENVEAIEKAIDYDFKFLIRYQSLNETLPKEEIIQATQRGKAVELSLQTMATVSGEVDIYEILNGKYDEYLVKYAQDIKETNVPILFRLNNEMNGDWCGYCAFHFAKDTDLYKEVWKYIYKIFEENGVDNVLWLWNANHKSFPNFGWNDQLLYYPGDEYVDIVGLTAYNTGNYYPGENWNSFEELYDSYYKEYDRLFEKPLMITEFGSNLVGGDKVAWVKDMFNKIKEYTNIKVAIWWSHIDYDTDGREARVYKIDRPAEVLNVFKENINL